MPEGAEADPPPYFAGGGKQVCYDDISGYTDANGQPKSYRNFYYNVSLNTTATLKTKTTIPPSFLHPTPRIVTNEIPVVIPENCLTNNGTIFKQVITQNQECEPNELLIPLIPRFKPQGGNTVPMPGTGGIFGEICEIPVCPKNIRSESTFKKNVGPVINNTQNPQWKSNAYRQEVGPDGTAIWVERTNKFEWNTEDIGLERYNTARPKVCYDEMRQGANFWEQYRLTITTTTRTYLEKPPFIDEFGRIIDGVIVGGGGGIKPPDLTIPTEAMWYSYIYKCQYCLPQQRESNLDEEEIQEEEKIVSFSNDFQNNITIFPNPANEVLNIAIEGDKIGGKVLIYDYTGKEYSTIYTTAEQNTLSLALDDYANGIYICQFIATNGTKSVKRFVVAK